MRPAARMIRMPERRTLADADGTADRDVQRRRARRAPRRRPARARSARGARAAADSRAAQGLPRGRAGRSSAARSIDAGGKPARHAHVYSHDLARAARSRARPTGSRSRPLDRPAAELVPAYLAAHPPDHPDYAVIADEDSDAWFGRSAGRKVRPDARQQRAGDRRTTPSSARILIADLADPEPPFAGPVGDGAVPRSGLPRDRSRAAGARARALANAPHRPRRHRGQPGRAALRAARLPARAEHATQSTCSARATIAAPSTPAGSVP